MPRKAVWADFELVASVNKRIKINGNEVTLEYSQFRCPYSHDGCKTLVELPSTNVPNNKSNACKDHLMKCNGVASDGRRAEDDPRIATTRKAAAECATHMQAAKRGRASDGLPQDEACTELTTERARR